MHQSVPCSVIRGGTSKGIFLLEKDLPATGDLRDQLLLRLMGSPDIRQIDGLGGATSVTSKVAIIAPSSRLDADVDYTFAQVSIDKPIVSYAGNCGNISSGVGPFAIENGIVKASEPVTTVRIYNTNTRKIMVEEVQTPEGNVEYDGDYSIAGVPGTAAPIKIMVMEPSGTVLNGLLPTGNPIDILQIPGFGALEVSIVDAANPLVFARASDLGLLGTELPSDIDKNAELLTLLEDIRSYAAKLVGLVENPAEASLQSPGVPKMTLLSPPKSYVATSGQQIQENSVDLLGRMMSMQKTHPTYAMTGAMCTAVASFIPGTIAYSIKNVNANPEFLRIGHPGGILEAGTRYTMSDDGNMQFSSAFGFRTARLILKGMAYC